MWGSVRSVWKEDLLATGTQVYESGAAGTCLHTESTSQVTSLLPTCFSPSQRAVLRARCVIEDRVALRTTTRQLRCAPPMLCCLAAALASGRCSG